MKTLFLFLLSFAFASSSFSQSNGQMKRRLNEEAIPKDILKKEYVLLVKLAFDNKKLVEKFTEAMQENYKGRFVIVPYKTKIDEAYADTSKYRFILAAPNALSKSDFLGANAAVANATKGLAPTSAWSKDFHIADRTNLAEYWNTNLSGQDHVKILRYLAARLSGIDPSED